MNMILQRKSKFALLILSIVFAISHVTESEQYHANPNATIPQGRLQGEIFKTRHNRDVFSFRGIPYAQPPIENLRFKEPVAAEPWNNTLFATRESNVCPQLLNGVFKGNEDCLYLNVYTPQLPVVETLNLLPVMVYIHGGGFERGNGGSALYGPRFILDKNVVLVTFNYRLGPLGFLSTGDGVVPGNNGLKDQVLALKWVQNNIEYFGGNPQRVTIFGQSTGACSVHLLALSNLTNGLFHQYITQSGSAFSIRAYRPRNIYKNRAFELGEYLKCPTNTSILLINCLRTLSAAEIIKTKPLFYKWKNFPDIMWGSTDEPNIQGAFLTDSPKNLYANGKIRDLPRIAGVVRNEGLLLSGDFYANPSKFEQLLANFDYVLPYVLQYDKYVNNTGARIDSLKKFYFNDDLTTNRSLLLSNFTDLLSDAFFIFPLYDALKQQLRFAKNPEYFYSFEYRGTFSNTYRFTNGSTADYGVAHNDELLYLFSETQENFNEPETKMSMTDFKIVDAMVQLWTSFATNGQPTVGVLTGNLTWEPYSLFDNYLRIGDSSEAKLSIQHSFISHRMRFWKELTASG